MTQFLSYISLYYECSILAVSTWSLVASVYDLQKVWLQRGTSDKESINVWLGDEFSGVLC